MHCLRRSQVQISGRARPRRGNNFIHLHRHDSPPLQSPVVAPLIDACAYAHLLIRTLNRSLSSLSMPEAWCRLPLHPTGPTPSFLEESTHPPSPATSYKGPDLGGTGCLLRRQKESVEGARLCSLSLLLPLLLFQPYTMFSQTELHCSIIRAVAMSRFKNASHQNHAPRALDEFCRSSVFPGPAPAQFITL